MGLKYETAIATLIQFVSLSLLGLANGLNSVITTCRHNSTDCVSNLIVSIIFFILTACWFGAIWMLGYFAQENRSKRLASLLIATECGVAIVAYFNARHNTDILSLVTSLADLVLAVWIINLAYRLFKAGNSRVVRRRRAYKHHVPIKAKK